MQELTHCAPFLLLLITIHVIAKTNARTTTVAATTTMTLIDGIIVAVSEDTMACIFVVADDTFDEVRVRGSVLTKE